MASTSLTCGDAETSTTCRYLNLTNAQEQAQFIKDKSWTRWTSQSFAVLDGRDIRQTIINKILSNTGTQTQVDSMRPFLADAVWL